MTVLQGIKKGATESGRAFNVDAVPALRDVFVEAEAALI